MAPNPKTLDRLQAGEELKANESLTSNNRRFRLIMQSDGNLVLYEGTTPRWESNTTGRGAVRACMQPDANFVLYTADQRPVWATDSDGGGPVFIVLQDDANLVIYQRGHAIWDRGRTSGNIDARSWLSKAVSTVGNTISSVPVVGTLAKAVVNFSPLPLINDIAHGQRIDRAALGSFKRQIQSTQEIAPYAQTVVSFVPGIGTGVSAAIGGAAALAQGKRIDDALISAVKGSLPGGPIAGAAFDIGRAAVSGQNISAAALDSVQANIPGGPAAQAAFATARKAIKGENIAASALESLHDSLPPAMQPAFKVGIAVAHGKNLQEATQNGAVLLDAARQVGGAIASKDDVLKAAQSAIPAESKAGFDTAVGLFNQGKSLTEQKLATMRKMLKPAELAGFDNAMALHMGRVIGVKAPPAMSATAKAAFYTVKGLRGAPKKVIAKTAATLGNTAEVKKGLEIGVKAAKLEQTRERGKAKPTHEEISYLTWFLREVKQLPAKLLS